MDIVLDMGGGISRVSVFSRKNTFITFAADRPTSHETHNFSARATHEQVKCIEIKFIR